MKNKIILSMIIIATILLTSCNPDSNTSIFYNMYYANPSSDFTIFSYVGDYDDSRIVLGTNLGIMLYDLSKDSNPSTIIVAPQATPLFLVYDSTNTYVVYNEQKTDQYPAKIKAANINAILSNGENKIVDAKVLIDGEPISISTVYAFADQDSKSVVSYTIQETKDKDSETITFHHVNLVTSALSDGILNVTITAESSKASSNSDLAAYIVGDGYVAYLNEDADYNKVFKIDGEDINPSDTGDVTCKNTDFISYYGEYNTHAILVDGVGRVYVDSQEKPDYGTFPLDNRRVAYSTVIDSKLFVCYKYGPEVLTFADSESEIKIDQLDTSDINNETVVGIKKYNNTYYVITEESEIIRTSLGL